MWFLFQRWRDIEGETQLYIIFVYEPLKNFKLFLCVWQRHLTVGLYKSQSYVSMQFLYTRGGDIERGQDPTTYPFFYIYGLKTSNYNCFIFVCMVDTSNGWSIHHSLMYTYMWFLFQRQRGIEGELLLPILIVFTP